jgi:anti-sigma factor RsiW
VTPLIGDLVCQQAVELMTDYLEGTLSWRQRRRLTRHLRGCPGCSAYLEQMRITIAALGKVEPEDLEPGVKDDLIGLFHRYRGTSPEE